MFVMMRTPRLRASGRTASTRSSSRGSYPAEGSAASRLLRDRNRPLGKALEDDDVELAALDQLDRRLDAVAGIPRAAADADRPCAHRANGSKNASMKGGYKLTH